MKRYLLLFVLSFFAMVLPVSADESNPQTIILTEFADQYGILFSRPYVIKVECNVVTITVANINEANEIMTVYDLSRGNIVLTEKVDAQQGLKVKATLKKGIYSVNFANVNQKVKIR